MEISGIRGVLKAGDHREDAKLAKGASATEIDRERGGARQRGFTTEAQRPQRTAMEG